MQPDPVHDPQRAALSALMDGEGAAAEAACGAWRADAGARADWHAYHLIGDLLRSDEHRCNAARDALFVARLRERLAREPVMLAPSAAAPMAAASRRPRAWMTPAAVAAGFVAVAGVLLATRMSTPDAPALADARGRAPAAGSLADAGKPALPAAPIDPGRVTLVRNAELDRYLQAHREYANASTLAAPAGVVRQAAVAAPGR